LVNRTIGSLNTDYEYCFPFCPSQSYVPIVILPQKTNTAQKKHQTFLGDCGYGHNNFNTSPLPLTDPRDAVPKAHRVVHRCRRSVS